MSGTSAPIVRRVCQHTGRVAPLTPDELAEGLRVARERLSELAERQRRRGPMIVFRFARAVYAAVGVFCEVMCPRQQARGVAAPQPLCPTCRCAFSSECPDAWHALTSSAVVGAAVGPAEVSAGRALAPSAGHPDVPAYFPGAGATSAAGAPPAPAAEHVAADGSSRTEADMRLDEWLARREDPSARLADGAAFATELFPQFRRQK